MGLLYTFLLKVYTNVKKSHSKLGHTWKFVLALNRQLLFLEGIISIFQMKASKLYIFPKRWSRMREASGNRRKAATESESGRWCSQKEVDKKNTQGAEHSFCVNGGDHGCQQGAQPSAQWTPDGAKTLNTHTPISHIFSKHPYKPHSPPPPPNSGRAPAICGRWWQ